MVRRDRCRRLSLTLAVGLLCAAAGCSSSSQARAAGAGAPARSGKSCGSARTGAAVPVTLVLTKGSADCATVRRVQGEYAALLRSGKVTGNGGGAPVRVSGWTCQSFPTPQVLRTGNASQCHTSTAEFEAVLVVPSPRQS